MPEATTPQHPLPQDDLPNDALHNDTSSETHQEETATQTHAIPGPGPGVIENFLLGLRVVWRESLRAGQGLLRRYERRALAKRLDEEYCRLGRIQAGHDAETSRALVMGQIGLLRDEIDALDRELKNQAA
ncbi:MAG: hypothetical protein AB7E32_05820 [Desulfovibrio sp.]